jgi:hypothetical protein
MSSETATAFSQRIGGMGVPDLIALDDTRRNTGDKDALLRQEIAERYNLTRDHGGTTLGFCDWKAAMRC